MWQCQTPAFVITTVSLETNENHVLMKSDLRAKLGGWWDGWQVCPQEDDLIWQPCNHMWMWGKADLGSTCAVRAHCTKPGDHTPQYSAVLIFTLRILITSSVDCCRMILTHDDMTSHKHYIACLKSLKFCSKYCNNQRLTETKKTPHSFFLFCFE